MSWQTYTQAKKPNGITYVTVQDIVELWEALDERIKTVYDLNSGVTGIPEIVTMEIITDRRSDSAISSVELTRLLDVVQQVGTRFATMDNGLWKSFASSGEKSITNLAALALGYTQTQWEAILGVPGDDHYKDMVVIDELDICRKAIQMMTHASLEFNNQDSNRFLRSIDPEERDGRNADYETAKDDMFAASWVSSTAPAFARMIAQRVNGCEYDVEAVRTIGDFKLSPKWKELGFSLFWQLEVSKMTGSDFVADDIITLYEDEPEQVLIAPTEGDKTFTFYEELTPDTAIIQGDFEIYLRTGKDRSTLDAWSTPTRDGCDSETETVFYSNVVNGNATGSPFGGTALIIGVPQYEYGDDPA